MGKWLVSDPIQYLLLFRRSKLVLDISGTLPLETCCLYSSWNGYLGTPDWVRVHQKKFSCGRA